MNQLEVTISRGHDSGKSTVGIISLSTGHSYVSLEDTKREIKLPGETCIPAGRYQIKFREVLSGLTKKYRAKFPWFTWHLMLQDVPNFSYVYMHIGNYPQNTDGCILVARTLDTSKIDMIQNSTAAFEEFYKIVSKALKEGIEVAITIKD